MSHIKYGTPEYEKVKQIAMPAILLHYERNSHHPEFYDNGINGMDLLDLVEMKCDWIAAGRRNKDSSMENSIKFNKERFKISDQLCKILSN